MTTQPISTGSIQAGAAVGGHDIGDIALLLAVMQIEMLDSDISGRLVSIDRLNKERRAYNDRIDFLNSLDDDLGTSSGWIAVQDLGRMDFAWDANAEGGAGGVVGAANGSFDGGPPYRVRMLDGGFALRIDDMPLDSPGIGRIGDVDDPDGTAPDEFPGMVELEFADLEEAQRAADRLGGDVVARITKDRIPAEIERLRNATEKRSSDGEMGMLQLNRVLSRRNQILQLTSNIMASEHQAAMGVINNLKV